MLGSGIGVTTVPGAMPGDKPYGKGRDSPAAAGAAPKEQAMQEITVGVDGSSGARQGLEWR